MTLGKWSLLIARIIIMWFEWITSELMTKHRELILSMKVMSSGGQTAWPDWAVHVAAIHMCSSKHNGNYMYHRFSDYYPNRISRLVFEVRTDLLSAITRWCLGFNIRRVLRWTDSMVILDRRANAELAPKLHIALRASYAALPSIGNVKLAPGVNKNVTRMQPFHL